MQKKHLLFALVLGAFTLMQVGCSTYSFTSRSNCINAIDIESNRQVADIEVHYKKKVSSTSDFQKFASQAKQQAVYQCIMEHNIDVLVDPIFEVEHRSMSGYRATVTGFAGYYKVGLNAMDEMAQKSYSKETIEKYLLLNDPNFYQYYYQKGEKGNVYNIKCETKVQEKRSFMTPDPAKKKCKAPKKERKQKKDGNLFQNMMAQ